MSLFRWSLILIIAGLFIGCAGSPLGRQEDGENRSNLLKLKIGMNKEQVLGIMGNQYKTEAYVIDTKNFEFWLYLTERWRGGPLRDYNFTPLALENETLVGWGRNYYNNILKIQQDIKIETK